MRPDPVQDPLLVFCPIGRDGKVEAELLRKGGLPARVIDSFDPPGGYAETGGLLVAEEAFDHLRSPAAVPLAGDPAALVRLSHHPAAQREGGVTAQVEARFGRLGNVTILERPLHPTTLVGAASTACARGCGNARPRPICSSACGPPRRCRRRGEPVPGCGDRRRPSADLDVGCGRPGHLRPPPFGFGEPAGSPARVGCFLSGGRPGGGGGLGPGLPGARGTTSNTVVFSCKRCKLDRIN